MIKTECPVIQQSVQWGFSCATHCKTLLCNALQYSPMQYNAIQCSTSSDTIVQHLSIVNPSGFLRILTSKKFLKGNHSTFCENGFQTVQIWRHTSFLAWVKKSLENENMIISDICQRHTGGASGEKSVMWRNFRCLHMAETLNPCNMSVIIITIIRVRCICVWYSTEVWFLALCAITCKMSFHNLRCFVAKSVLSQYMRACVKKSWTKNCVCGEKWRYHVWNWLGGS